MATIIYLAAFAALGMWSAFSERHTEPLVEVVSEATSVLVLSGGVVLHLLATPFPGGNRVWLVPFLLAVVAEGAVILRGRNRTLNDERVLGTPGLAWKSKLTDVATVAFFTPAVLLNLKYALR